MPKLTYTWDDPELWSELPQYPNYRISTWGRICNVKSGFLLRTHAYSEDYPLKVCLSSHGERKDRLVHRLVAETFLSNFLPHHHVKFIDGNLHNPHVLNLKVAYTGLGQFLGGEESVLVRRIVSSEDKMYETVKQAARDLDCHVAEVYDVIDGRRRYIRGVELDRVWVRGAFDGDKFVPWPDEGLGATG